MGETPTIRKGPTLSIGLPVYNGQNYLEQAVATVLGQRYTDFELILCDNASTDRTRAICESFAAADPRVRYERSETNVGLVRNFNRAFELSTGRYFKWLSHDDLLGPEFLQQCIDQLEADPTLSVCCTSVAVIDADGYVLEAEEDTRINRRDPLGITRLRDAPGPERELEDARVSRRHRGVLLNSTRCYEEFGVIRASAIRSTPLRGFYPGSEKVFLTELALLGKIKVLPDIGMFMRVHDDRLSSQAASCDRRALYLAPSATRKRSWLPPQVRCTFGYAGALLRQPMPLGQRLGCLVNLALFCLQFRKWHAICRIALWGREPVVVAQAPSRGQQALRQLDTPVVETVSVSNATFTSATQAQHA